MLGNFQESVKEMSAFNSSIDISDFTNNIGSFIFPSKNETIQVTLKSNPPQTVSFVAKNFNIYDLDSTSGSIQVTLPAGVDGSIIFITNSNGSFATNNCSIVSSSLINGANSTIVCSNPKGIFECLFEKENNNWNVAEINEAGGGGGGSFLSSVLPSGQVYIGNQFNIGSAKTLSGDVLLDFAGISSVQPNAISNAKLAQAGARTWKGNNSGATGNQTDNTAASITESVSSVLTLSAANSVLNPVTIGVKRSSAIMDGYLAGSDFATFSNKQAKIAGATNNNLVLTDSAGQTFDSGKSVSTDGAFASNSDNFVPTVKATKTYADTRVPISQLGVANGAATLNGSGQLTSSQVPSSLLGVVVYQGTWNASTNTPTLVSSVGTKGFYYLVSVAGNTSLDGISPWLVNDTLIFNGTTWNRLSGNCSIYTLQNVATTGGTTALSSTSPTVTRFTGTSSEIVVLPNATSLAVGTQFVILNESTGSITINNSSGTTLGTITPLNDGSVTLAVNGSVGGTWHIPQVPTSIPTANTIVEWDENKNLKSNNNLTALTSTATSSSPVNLLIGSAFIQRFTGSTAQTVILPNVTGVASGLQFLILNESSATMTITNHSSFTIGTLLPMSDCLLTLSVGGSTNGTWHIQAIQGTSIPTASTLAKWDNSSNLSANSFSSGLTSIVTTGGTTTLSQNSTQIQRFTGVSNQVVVLPNATSLPTGFNFKLQNESTGALNLQNAGLTTISTVASNSDVGVVLAVNGTVNGIWHVQPTVILHAYETVPTATTIAQWDANKNFSADVFIPGVTSSVSSNSVPITLSNTSNQVQRITGIANQTIILPDARTLLQGFQFLIQNEALIMNIQNNSLTNIAFLSPGNDGLIVCVSNSTQNGVWHVEPSANTLPTPQTKVMWDLNKNVSFNNYVPTVTLITTAGGNTLIQGSSPLIQRFSGTLNQTVTLPDATNLVQNIQFAIQNESTGFLSIRNASLAVLGVVPPLTDTTVQLTTAGTVSGTWRFSPISASTNVNNKTFYVSSTGSDSNNGLSPSTSVATLAQACTLAGGSGNLIVVFPGTYTETLTITNQNLSILGFSNDGASIVNFNGTLTVNNSSSSVRITGIKFNSLVHSGAGSLYLNSVSTSVSLSLIGTGVFLANNCDSQGPSFAGTVSVTTAGSKVFQGGCTIGTLTVNAASAIVNISFNLNCLPITLLNGTLGISNTPVYSATPTSNAISVTSGVLSLNSMQCITSSNTPARISLSGAVFSFWNSLFDYGNSTITTTTIVPTNINFDSLAIQNRPAQVRLASSAVKTSAFIAEDFNMYNVNTTSTSFTATLAAAPADGSTIYFTDSTGTFGTNNLVLNRNGKLINGVALNFACNSPGATYFCLYNNTTGNWTVTTPPTSTVVVDTTSTTGTMGATVDLNYLTVSSPIVRALPTASTVSGKTIKIANSPTSTSFVSVSGPTSYNQVYPGQTGIYQSDGTGWRVISQPVTGWSGIGNNTSGTTVLTSQSPPFMYLFSSSSQTITMPVVNTCYIGQKWTITNSGALPVNVNSSNGSLIGTVPVDGVADFIVISTTDLSNAAWFSSNSYVASVNNVAYGSLTVAANPAFTYLVTAATPNFLIFTGSVSAHSLRLPDATTVTVGTSWRILNSSASKMFISPTSGASITQIPTNICVMITCTGNSTSIGTWHISTLQDCSGNSEVSAIATLGTQQTIPNGVVTNLTCYTTVLSNGLSQYNSTTNVFTAATAGLYYVRCGLSFVGNNVTGWRYVELWSGSTSLGILCGDKNPGTYPTLMVGSGMFRLNANQVINFKAFQNSGVGLALHNNDDVNQMQIVKISA